jgi:hypothetical protein
MFVTTELFGKFHSTKKTLRITTTALRQKNLHHMEALCTQWIGATRLAPRATGRHSRQRLYTAKLTFLTFLAQTLNPGASCRAAVRQLQAYYQSQPQPRHLSLDDSPYCQARAGLDPDLLIAIRRDIAQRMAQVLPTWDWTWGQPVKLLDGTCLSLPDTVENQAAYPQTDSQKAGCGFPQLRLLGLFSLDTGALLERVRGQYKTSEVQLFRRLWPQLEAGDLVLGDRIFGYYTALAHLLQHRIDGIFRQNAQRNHDFRRGQRLGHHDRLMTWFKPLKKAAGLTAEEWARVPDQITVREVKIQINDPQCRVKEIVLVTTLLDPK